MTSTKTTRRAAIVTMAAAAIVPVTASASNADADLIALGERYEPLLLQYIDATADWAPRLEDAHRRARRDLGIPEAKELWRVPDEDRDRFHALLHTYCEENGHEAASDRVGELYDAMDPMEDTILSADVKSLAGLRARALVSLRNKIPACADETEFEFSSDFERSLFYAVLDITGLTAMADETEAKLIAAHKAAEVRQ